MNHVRAGGPRAWQRRGPEALHVGLQDGTAGLTIYENYDATYGSPHTCQRKAVRGVDEWREDLQSRGHQDEFGVVDSACLELWL